MEKGRIRQQALVNISLQLLLKSLMRRQASLANKLSSRLQSISSMRRGGLLDRASCKCCLWAFISFIVLTLGQTGIFQCNQPYAWFQVPFWDVSKLTSSWRLKMKLQENKIGSFWGLKPGIERTGMWNTKPFLKPQLKYSLRLSHTHLLHLTREKCKQNHGILSRKHIVGDP